MSRLIQDLTLEQIDDWFKIGKKVVVETHARSASGGKPVDDQGRIVDHDVTRLVVPAYKSHSRLQGSGQTDYAVYYRQQYLQSLVAEPEEDDDVSTLVSQSTRLDDIETASYISGSIATLDSLRHENNIEVYKNYRFEATYDPNLTITKWHEEIINTIESNPVTVIVGSTGSGKTTQVPQYILDHYASQKRYCNIIITQPRRIAAQSIAQRVCRERGWQCGSVCGYQVARDRIANDDTRILYVTTGVLLEKLINTKNMLQFTHIILDEVHERDQDTDFSLLVVRKLLRENSKHVKVILMSATIDAGLFAEYFGIPIGIRLEPAPVVNVEGKAFKVAEFHIDDLASLGVLPPKPLIDKPSLNQQCIDLTSKLIAHFDKIEKQTLGIVGPGLSPKRGTVLVFLPGYAEITEVMDSLEQYRDDYNLKILPLHSSISLDEQSQVFFPPEPGMRKVILSTNIAESSITVPDIRYVIDFCLTKVLWCDPDTNITSLIVTWAAKANCLQRKGRAGRVNSGRVYRMVTKTFYEQLPDYGTPEMLRCPLEQVILKCKKLNMGEPKAIFALALDPPPLDDIERTVLMLKEVAALTTHRIGRMNPHDGELTFIGHVLASLPVDIHVGKLLILGHIFGVLEDSIIIGACLSLPSLFRNPFRDQFKAYSCKLGWSQWSYSDCITMKNAYMLWEENTKNGMFRRGGARNEKEWCHEMYLQLRRLREVRDLSRELTQRLEVFNIRVPRLNRNRLRKPEEDDLILKVVICGAFYPNYFVKVPIDECEAVKTLSGNDPFTCVLVKGLPTNHGALYRNKIQEIFQNRYCCGTVASIAFEDTRAYVEFEPSTYGKHEVGNKRPLKAVYLATKLRQVQVDLTFTMFDPDAVVKRFERLSVEVAESQKDSQNRLRSNRIRTVNVINTTYKHVGLPGPYQQTVPVVVSHVVDCGHFWAYYRDNIEVQRELQFNIHKYMSDYNEAAPKNINIGTICLAPFEDGFYRAKVVKLEPQNINKIRVYTAAVFFVDYGNISQVPVSKLKNISTSLIDDFPLQAIECQLSAIKPSSTRCRDGEWSQEAHEFFTEQVMDRCIIVQIYSVIQNKMRVIAVVNQDNGVEVNINEQLILKRLAEEAEEPFLSRQNNLQRQRDASRFNADGDADSWIEMKIGNEMITEKRSGRVKLLGPWNPLEATFTCMSSMGKFRVSKLERDSVNSVFLDDQPQDFHERLMVAAHVALNPSGNTIICRNTTIMPNIHGFPALMSLVFTPAMELRRSPDCTRFIGAIFGLGQDPETGGPALPDHDMEITFDVEISTEDITLVNKLRGLINLAVGSREPVIQWGFDQMERIRRSARDEILKLLEVKRPKVEPTHCKTPYIWGEIPDEDILLHQVKDEDANSAVLLQLHNSSVLLEVQKPKIENPYLKSRRLIEHVQWLRSKAGRSTEKESITCELCDVTCVHARDLMMHLHTLNHTVNEKNLNWM